MAILKHKSSKNANYNDVIDYLIYQHNEQTNTPILDANGDMIPREEYFLDGINCDPDTFALECRELNRRWGKNQDKDDVKTHQYILSFDPKDVPESGLTGEKVQELALEFANRNFPGHQILVCTHMDGHNRSGNIHAHIVLNSLRKYDVPEDHECYVERPSDLKAGYKHHQTREMLEYLKADVMEMCQRESLRQVDLLQPAERKKNDREYFAQRRGQEKLDRERGKTGGEPKKFQTQKDFLRDAIDDCSKTAKSREEFEALLTDRYKIKVTESRGRISYLHPERKQNITGRALGANYEMGYLNQVFARNREGGSGGESSWDENAGSDPYHEPHSYDSNHDYTKDPVTVLYIRSGIRLVVDMQTDMKVMLEARTMLAAVRRDRKGEYDRDELKALTDKIDTDRERVQAEYDRASSDLETVNTQLIEALNTRDRDYTQINSLKNQKSELSGHVRTLRTELNHCTKLKSQIEMQTKLGYEKTVQIMERSGDIANLKMMARTICWVQDHGYDTREKLEKALQGAAAKRQKVQDDYSTVNEKLRQVNREITCMGRYLTYKPVYQKFLSAANKGKFRNQHKKEITAYEDAVKELRQIHSDGKFATMKDLRLKKADLQAEKDHQYQELKYYREQEKDLNVICTNVDSILNPGKEQTIERSREQDRERPERQAEKEL